MMMSRWVQRYIANCSTELVPSQCQFRLPLRRATYTSHCTQQLDLHAVYRFSSCQKRRSSSSSSSSSSLSSLLVIHEQVQEALETNKPVVALESTIIAHGMPYPENLYLSERIAKILREKGVEPATIAIKDGKCHIGLSKDEIQDLAISSQEHRAVKCSTRELSLFLSKHKHKHHQYTNTSSSKPLVQWGATTVAATMKLAHIAGISTFVTGGIGGVHRDGQNTLDISTDLIELSRTPVIVVSAGIKSILDIQRTLEVLETYGVPVIAYQTDEFPAFFSPNSGVKTPERMDNVDQIAIAYTVSQQLGLSHGIFVGVPNIDPAGENVEHAIQAALIEANELGISGRDVTPFILKNVAMRTHGDSLRSNMALVERNATVGAAIAIAVAQHATKNTTLHHVFPSTKPTTTRKAMTPLPKSKVIVMGGIVLDIVARPVHGQVLTIGTSNPSICIESDGGVGRNIAETLCRLGSYPLLYSAVGNDSRGHAIVRRLIDDCCIVSLDQTVQIVSHANTATYIAILNEHRDLHTACADMEIHEHVVPPPIDVLQQAEYLILDANPPINILQQTVKTATEAGVKVFFDPTSVPKAKILCEDDKFLSCLTYATPNVDELHAMAGINTTPPKSYNNAFDQSYLHPVASSVIDRMNPNGAHLIVTCDSKGVLLASKENQASNVTFQYFPVTSNVLVQNATGAGDTLSGAFIHALLHGKSVSDAVEFGMKAATLSLQCPDKAISPRLSELKDFH
jgi:pseudouridine-5'-phosphate glycosidase/sugar/nucleoside kinase (ribokinase family)